MHVPMSSSARVSSFMKYGNCQETKKASVNLNDITHTQELQNTFKRQTDTYNELHNDIYTIPITEPKIKLASANIFNKESVWIIRSLCTVW